MPLTREEFYRLEAYDTFYGFDRFRTPVVVDVSEKGGQRNVSVEWQRGDPIICVWDEVAERVITADGSENRDVDRFSQTYVQLWPETVSRLASKWLDEGKLSHDDYERLLKAQRETSKEAMDIMMSD